MRSAHIEHPAGNMVVLDVDPRHDVCEAVQSELGATLDDAHGALDSCELMVSHFEVCFLCGSGFSFIWKVM